MANTFSQLYVHFVWSTKERRNLILPAFQENLYQYIGGIIKSEGGVLMEIGGIENHIHLLVHLPLSLQIPELVRRTKSSSSKWIHEKAADSLFSWQEGYGAFSVSQSMVPVLSRYILKQQEHHKKWSFEEEYLELLKCHKVAFEEKYALG